MEYVWLDIVKVRNTAVMKITVMNMTCSCMNAGWKNPLCVSGVFLAASMGTTDNHEVVFRLTVFITEILVVSDFCADL